MSTAFILEDGKRNLTLLFRSGTVLLLLEHILKKEKSETAIVGGIQVLLALLDVYQSR